MLNRITLVVLSLCCLSLSAVAQEVDRTGAVAAAERLAKLGQISLARQDVGDDNFRQAVALLSGAVRLNPNEPRYLRLLTDAQLQLKDTAGAIATLQLYTALARNDQVARLQLVDLYVAQMETAEARLKYLTEDLLQNEKFSPEFRAAIAVRAARVYQDRDQSDSVNAMVDKAMALNPLDPDACELNWLRKRSSEVPSDRIAAILAMLRSNPTQTTTMDLLAGELAGVGMHDVAQRWYTRSNDLLPRSGRSLDRNVFLDAAVSSFILGQAKTAEGRVALLVSENADNFDAVLVNLLCARRIGGEQQVADALTKVTDSLVRRINGLHVQVAGSESPTTKPAGELIERIPDVAADAVAVKAKGDAALSEAYAEALTELAFVTLCYARKPADAEPLLASLRTLLPENSVVMSRLDGWHLMLSGKADEAKVKLATVADRDPLSRLGLIKLAADGDKSAAAADAQALLNANPSGLLGALLTEALSEFEVRAEPAAEVVGAINAEMAKFPLKWLDINDSPSDFYALTATAGKVPFAFGESMIVTVTVKNISGFDIPVGPKGTLRPDLWFDCSVKTGQQQQVPGVTFERFGQELVLRRNKSIEHTCRVDQGQLWQVMQSNPAASFPLYYTVFTNPVPSQALAAPGPAGYRHTLRMIERQPTPIMNPTVRNEIFKKLSMGEAADRIRVAEMLAQYVQLISNMQNAEQTADVVRQLREAIEQGVSDSDLLVRGWSTYITAAMSSDSRRTQLVQKMASSKDWLQRMLVLVLLESFPADLQKELLDKLTGDEDALVKQLAEATRDYIARVPAATQPSENAAAPLSP